MTKYIEGQVIKNKYLTSGTIFTDNEDDTYDIVWSTGEVSWDVPARDIFDPESYSEISVTELSSSEITEINAKIRHQLENATDIVISGSAPPTIDSVDTNPIRRKVEDVVNHPTHYTTGLPPGVEVIDIIRAQQAGYEHGNVLKYILRWQYKNGLEDLKKARVYLDWLIEKVENDNA